MLAWELIYPLGALALGIVLAVVLWRNSAWATASASAGAATASIRKPTRPFFPSAGQS